ncbi:sigma-70 family RNA polymerase sigma factor [bacterium]|nr:sigma-70 family RNA polymerase sigma factor [bacterium]
MSLEERSAGKTKTECTDEELIEAIRCGDREAADEIIKRYYIKVGNTCRRYFICPDDINDATQEVFTKIFAEKKVGHYRGQAQFWTWLYRVVCNTCKTMLLKQQQARKIYSLDHRIMWEEKEQYGNMLGSPEYNIHAEQKKDLVLRMMKALPRNYRAIIYLIYWKGCSYKEAAHHMNVPINILGVQLMRGKNMLNKIGRPLFSEYTYN